MSNIQAVILAAGKGSRMKSELPKVLHKVGGESMVARVLKTLNEVSIMDVITVVGHKADMIIDELQTHTKYAIQKEQLGTGHAVQMALEFLEDDKETIVMTGDTPLITPETLRILIADHVSHNRDVTVLTTKLDNPFGYGRILRNSTGEVMAIIEQKDATPEQAAVNEVNTGIFCFKNSVLKKFLSELKPNNAQKEYYLTDVVSLVEASNGLVGGYCTENTDEVMGINDVEQLQMAEAVIAKRKQTVNN